MKYRKGEEARRCRTNRQSGGQKDGGDTEGRSESKTDVFGTFTVKRVKAMRKKKVVETRRQEVMNLSKLSKVLKAK